MDRTEAIRRHPLFQEAYTHLQQLEADRIFCRHSMEHLLSVARLMYIYSLEDQSGLSRELIYAAALLHDIGRWEEAVHGTPHEAAGASLAGIILSNCGFSPEEIRRIQNAILSHRRSGGDDPLAIYLYRADKQSRPCYACPAVNACNWPDAKKNLQLIY